MQRLSDIALILWVIKVINIGEMIIVATIFLREYEKRKCGFA